MKKCSRICGVTMEAKGSFILLCGVEERPPVVSTLLLSRCFVCLPSMFFFDKDTRTWTIINERNLVQQISHSLSVMRTVLLALKYQLAWFLKTCRIFCLNAGTLTESGFMLNVSSNEGAFVGSAVYSNSRSG